jgi:hypothetical protein
VAGLRAVGPILYANSGDWVESCTALVEHPDGRLEVITPGAVLRTPGTAHRARSADAGRISA